MRDTRTVTVGIGEVYTTNDPSLVLAALGLGSCVGVVAYDSFARAGGVAHPMLPQPRKDVGEADSRYVDEAIGKLLANMVTLGARLRRVQCKIVGGAQILASYKSGGGIGERNVAASLYALRNRGIALKAMDVGGNCGRSVRLFVNDGRVLVRSIGCGEFDL